MNTKLFKLILIYISFCWVSCGNQESNQISLEGKWSSLNEEEEYVEFWFFENKAMLLEEFTYTPEFYEFRQTDDSLLLIIPETNVVEYALAIQSIDQETLIISNEFNTVKIKKFSSGAIINLNDSLLTEIYKEFSERLSSKKLK